jgi:protein subunit release factor B
MKGKLLFSVTKNDFDVQTFRAGGKGGQHQNTADSVVRIIHGASGAVGECREHRHRLQNKKEAFKRPTSSFEFKH